MSLTGPKSFFSFLFKGAIKFSQHLLLSPPQHNSSAARNRALSYGQDVSRSLGLKELGNELLLVGMVRSAGADDMDVRKVLTNFGISPDGTMTAAEGVLKERMGLVDVANRGMDFNDLSALPFSSAAKRTLDDAISIARRMSPTPDVEDAVIQTGHVLLALLEYDDRYGVATEDVAKCAGLAVLTRTSQDLPVSKSFDGTKFCRALADEMKKNKGTTTVKLTERELVFVNGDRVSGSTPTL